MSEFHDKLIVTMEKQFQIYEPYQSLCEMENVKFQDIKTMIHSGALHLIPAIPADWFKKNKSRGLFAKLSNFQNEGQWLVSSSTSGDSSYTWRTDADIQFVSDSFLRAFQKAPSCNSIFFSPNIEFLNKIGSRFAIDDRPIRFYATVPTLAAEDYFQQPAYMAKLNTLSTMWAMIKTRGKGRPVLDLQENTLLNTIKAAEHDGTRLLFAISVLMLYPTLMSLPDNYSLGDNAYFFTGAGGWDGKKGASQGASIDKPKFVADMVEKFNIPDHAVETNFWDGYGTTENGKAQAGAYSKEYSDFVFTVQDDVKLYIISPITGKPAHEGEKGYPRFVSPYGVEGFAGACIQQNDIVTVVSLFDDGSVKQFTHISRASGDEGAGGVGCAYELVEGVRV